MLQVNPCLQRLVTVRLPSSRPQRPSVQYPECCPSRARVRAVSSRVSETRYLASGSLDGSSTSVRLGSYVALWFGTSCVFNILNKLTLNVFPMPLFISTWQLVASSMFMVCLWSTGSHPKPTLPPRFLFHLLPVALFHTIGHIAACVSFTKMAVSFTHVVKASGVHTVLPHPLPLHDST